MNVVAAFQEMKRIFGVCPCCGEVFRLSDATVFTRDPPPKTEFDRLREARERFERQEEKFHEEIASLREKATRKGWLQARNRLRRIAPAFVGRGIDPQDVKVIFDPVEYVVFRGLNNKNTEAIKFVDREPNSSRRERVLNSIKRVIRSGNLEWHTYRVNEDGTVTRE
jgi:predicted Holliday junction resolvase-like endonuclease